MRASEYLDILNEARKGQELALEHVVLLGAGIWDDMLAGGVDVPALTPVARGRGQHPVHFRHHRPAEGRDADASQPGEQRLCGRAGDDVTCARPALLAGAAVSLLWMRDELAAGDGVRNRADPARGAIRPAGHAAGHRRRALHADLRRTHHVHRRIGASGLPQVRYAHAAQAGSWRARHVPWK